VAVAKAQIAMIDAPLLSDAELRALPMCSFARKAIRVPSCFFW
jgi:hypothetical protein